MIRVVGSKAMLLKIFGVVFLLKTSNKEVLNRIDLTDDFNFRFNEQNETNNFNTPPQPYRYNSD